MRGNGGRNGDARRGYSQWKDLPTQSIFSGFCHQCLTLQRHRVRNRAYSCRMPNIQLSNDDSAKEFKVTVWRTIQKDTDTIQKSDSTIQKELGPNFAKVLNYLKEHLAATVNEAANSIDGISLGSVKFIIRKLQEKGFLKRIGGRKLGKWQVLA